MLKIAFTLQQNEVKEMKSYLHLFQLTQKWNCLKIQPLHYTSKEVKRKVFINTLNEGESFDLGEESLTKCSNNL